MRTVNNHIRIAVLSLVLLFFFTGCDKGVEYITLTVASKKITPEYSMFPPVYTVKYEDDSEWRFFYYGINGFDEIYQEGYEYVIYVKSFKVSNPPMDAGSRSYKLVTVRSCEEKESEGLDFPHGPAE